MKKFILTLVLFLSGANLSFANYNDIYIADIKYDWINKTEIEKDSIISEIHDIMFKDGELEKKEYLKSEFKDFIKDKNRKQHYLKASAGHKECEKHNLSASYYKKQKHIYMYTLQNKKDFSKTFYYDALGKLRYIDFVYGEYPEYPYYVYQYNTSGKPISAIYYVSNDTQYLFEPNGTFTGLWYKHNLYNQKSKIIQTRTTY